jgi:hypothetical protein
MYLSVGGLCTATEVEARGVRLLRGFDEGAKGDTETAVFPGEAAQRAGFDYGSEYYDAALRYLLDSVYLRPDFTDGVGGEGYSIAVAGRGRMSEG